MNKITGLAALAFFAILPFGALAGDASTQPITVYKSPTCGCCEVWTDAMHAAGHPMTVHHTDDFEQIKARAGVPLGYESCHTAYIDLGRTYVLEGHVPLEAIEKLIAEQPDIQGLTVPGMPSGSLGMGGPLEPYAVYAFNGKGQVLPVPFLEVTE